MLIFARIKNFKSIREEITLDMRFSTKIYKKDLSQNLIDYNPNLLKSAVFYGRNASGKSNILTALRYLTMFVRSSDENKHGDLIRFYKPFLFDTASSQNPVHFEIEFVSSKNKLKFNYEIKFTEKEIIYESLYVYPKGVKSKLYSRENKSYDYGIYFKGNKKLSEDVLPNQLFLSKLARTNTPYIEDAYLFFNRQIGFSPSIEVFNENRFSEYLMKNKNVFHNTLEILKSADTNICNISINKSDDKMVFPENLPEEIKVQIRKEHQYDFKTKHPLFEKGKNIGDAEISLNEESHGTRRLLSLSTLVYSSLFSGRILIIDELDNSLHPLISKLIISFYNSLKNNPNNAQLIFATHDSSLLDKQIFRRDQIYFVDKEYEGNTFLYRLSDIKGIRKDIPYDRWYLSGRFSAIPIINEVELQFE